MVDADHDANAHAGSNDLRDGHVHHRCELIGGNKLGKFEHFAFCCFVCQLFFHALTDGFTLLATILGALTHLCAFASKAGKCLAYLLCNFFVAYLGLQWNLLRLVLLLLVLASASTLILLLTAAAILLLTCLWLICNSIDIDTLLAYTETLLLVATLSLKAFTATLLVCFLLRTCCLVQAVEVNLAFNG